MFYILGCVQTGMNLSKKARIAIRLDFSSSPKTYYAVELKTVSKLPPLSCPRSCCQLQSPWHPPIHVRTHLFLLLLLLFMPLPCDQDVLPSTLFSAWVRLLSNSNSSFVRMSWRYSGSTYEDTMWVSIYIYIYTPISIQLHTYTQTRHEPNRKTDR